MDYRSEHHVQGHTFPSITNINDQMASKQTRGEHVADKISAVIGSWPFIIIQSCVLLAWICFNVYLMLNPAAIKAFDPYPFILLNLALSFQAAYTGPIVLMSENRQAKRDRMVAENDYTTNVKAEKEIRLIMEHLQRQDRMMQEVLARLEDQKSS